MPAFSICQTSCSLSDVTTGGTFESAATFVTKGCTFQALAVTFF